jgi:NAD(P)-dependent dehydrogenase (short-subunit alcohol dehydrogenase family)
MAGDREGRRVALVTGAAKGIGATIAARLARGGLCVLMADVDEEGARSAAAVLEAEGLEAHGLRLDVSDPASVAAAFASVDARWGRCDVLVNNAGIAKTFAFLEFPLDAWRAHLEVNVTGVLLCSQHGARLMQRRGWGRVVNVASVAGMRAVGVGRTAYGTSKAAVIGLTRQMAVELAADGITANAVAPGPVDTPMTRVLHSERFREDYSSAIPMRRYGTQEEVAATVAFLASEEASYITGAVLPVDGGFLASGAHRW